MPACLAERPAPSHQPQCGALPQAQQQAAAGPQLGLLQQQLAGQAEELAAARKAADEAQQRADRAQAAADKAAAQQGDAAALAAKLAAANKELDITVVAATKAEQDKAVLKEQVGWLAGAGAAGWLAGFWRWCCLGRLLEVAAGGGY